MKAIMSFLDSNHNGNLSVSIGWPWSVHRLSQVVLVLCFLMSSIFWLIWLIYSPIPHAWWEWLLAVVGTVILVAVFYRQWYTVHWLARALSEREVHFHQIIEAAPNAMVILDIKNTIVFVNKQVEVTFGYLRQELQGKNVELLIPERYRVCYLRVLQDYRTNGKGDARGTERPSLYGRRQDGVEFPLELNLAPIDSRTGRTLLLSITDISERQAIEHAFRAQAEHVALVSRYKSEFLANMSHELRTPLNSILILSEQLRDRLGVNLNPRQVEFADIIHKSGEDLLALINDVLDLSRIEAGKMPVRPEKVIVSKFARTLHTIFFPLAQEKSLELTLDIEQDMPDVVSIDLQRVNQIVKNLLSNAIKFTDKGGVYIRIFLTKGNTVENHDPLFSISVTDTGPGIPEEKHTLIFHAFQQLDGSSSRRFGGSGLGLAISQQLAELVGGYITVKSLPGLGSTFTLTIPISSPHGQAPVHDKTYTESLLPVEVSRAKPACIQTPTVLGSDTETDNVLVIVEDDHCFATAIERIATEQGFAVRVFSQVSDVIAFLHCTVPAAIIVDILLPESSGWQIIEHLRRDRATCHVPALVITCMDDMPKRNDKYTIDYLVKPVDSQQLILAFAQLRKAIGGKKGEDAPHWIPADSVTYIGSTGSSRIKDGVRVLLVDDDVRNVYAISSLLEARGMLVLVARDGEEALRTAMDHDIDIVLMDMMMPVLDGYEATRRLRSELGFKKPILAVTALAMKGDREKCLAAGADDYLAKPVSRDALYACLDRWIQVKKE